MNPADAPLLKAVRAAAPAGALLQHHIYHQLLGYTDRCDGRPCSAHCLRLVCSLARLLAGVRWHMLLATHQQALPSVFEYIKSSDLMLVHACALTM